MQYVWVILLFLPRALSESGGKFRLVVPDSPVFSVSGSDVILSCSVQEVHQNIIVNAVDLNVTWSRSDLKDSLVHLYGNHEDLNTDQNPSYRGRTAVFKEELKNGNASLKLSNVGISDEGEYTCRVDSTTWWKSKTIKLSVEAVGSKPVITVEKYESGKFSLLCESKGWRPEPELQWRNSKGVNLTAETETQPVADLFNVKSRITVEEIGLYFCTVTQRNHEKEGRIDAHTLNEHVPRDPGKIVGITIGDLLLVGVLAGVIFYIANGRRKRQKEINDVKLYMSSDEDGRLQHDLSPHQWDYVFTLLKDLKEFNLRKFDPSDKGVEKLKKVIASSEKALLKQCNLTEKSCEVLASVLSSENSLTELDLSLNKLEDSGVKKLFEGLKDSHFKLQILRLEECDLSEVSGTILAKVLGEKNSLIELHLSKNKRLKDLGVKNLCVGLNNKNCELQILWLEDCNLTEKSCKHLAEVLSSGNSKLEELNLSRNILKDLGVENPWVGLKDKKCKLKILRLEDCDLREKSCEYLASVLKSENSLIELNLSQNKRLENLGVENLCDGLKDEHCKLKILRLAECSITEKGFSALASALIENPSSPLEELDLSGNGLKESELKLFSKLKDTLPKLKVKLDKCSITDKGCAAPTSALKENPPLPSEEQDPSGNELEESEKKLLHDDTSV